MNAHSFNLREGVIKIFFIFFPFQNILHLILKKPPILVAARGLTLPLPFTDRSVTNCIFLRLREAAKKKFLH